MQFALASKIQKKSISSAAAESYSSDLLGSAFGALLTSAFLIPLLGIIKVGIVLGILNILIAVIILLKRKRYLSYI
jgi:predicted membrane-bound spermidine synthase